MDGKRHGHCQLTTGGLYFSLPCVLQKTDHTSREETGTQRHSSFLVFLVFKYFFLSISDDLYTSTCLEVTFTPRS